MVPNFALDFSVKPIELFNVFLLDFIPYLKCEIFQLNIKNL